MITPEWYTYELDILKTHKELQEQILRDIARRIVKTDMNITETAVWQTEMAQKTGILYDDIIKEIAKRTGGTTAEIRQIFKNAKVEVFNYDDEMLIENGQNPEIIKNISPKMQDVMKSALAKTSTEAKNLTKTTAVTSQTSYLQACDLAHQKVVSGAFSYGEAIKSAVKFAANQGVKVIYPSGHISSLDVAVRRSVLTGVNQTAGQLQKMRADELECDIMEISAHSGARPSHALWQGQLVSRSGKKGYLSLDDIGYGEVTRFMGANCRHNWYMYFGGMRMYTSDELYAMNNAKVTYNGEVYTEYDAMQIQRKFERDIRKYKNELVMFDETMKNTDGDVSEIKTEFNFTAQKLKRKETALADFCEQTGLRRDKYREQVFAVKTEKNIANFGRSVSSKAVWANKNALTNGGNGGIIKEKGFTPVSNINEAEQYAKRFSKSVNFSNVKEVNSVNVVNETLSKLTAKYPIEELTNISTKKLKKANAQAHGKLLEINADYLNNPNKLTDWKTRIAYYPEQISTYKKIIDSGDYPSNSAYIKNVKKHVKQLENEMKFNRWSVSTESSNPIAATVSHEYGHIIADQYFGQINGSHFCTKYNETEHIRRMVDSTFAKAKKNGDIYNISKYASSNRYEFFAECFAAKYNGEKLPDYITKMLEEALKR